MMYTTGDADTHDVHHEAMDIGMMYTVYTIPVVDTGIMFTAKR